jgi:signal transduction histidine kinase
VVGDAPRLEQLLHNLVDNAVKFSPEGGPVEVTLEAQGGEAVLSVADRGVGLFFCREVAERHGGSLSLRPREGGGAVATLRLPLAAPP